MLTVVLIGWILLARLLEMQNDQPLGEVSEYHAWFSETQNRMVHSWKFPNGWFEETKAKVNPFDARDVRFVRMSETLKSEMLEEDPWRKN